MAVVTTFVKNLVDANAVSYVVNSVTLADGATLAGYDVTLSGTSILPKLLSAVPTHLVNDGTKVAVVAALTATAAGVLQPLLLGKAFPPETIHAFFTCLGMPSQVTLAP